MQSNELFADKYAKDDTTYEGDYTVNIDPDNDVVEKDIKSLVAPGTKSVEAATATVFGTPEVATRYKLVVDGLEDVFLKAGTYTDFTKLVSKTDDEGNISYGYFDTFTLADNYYPVKWDIKVENEAGKYYLLTELAQRYDVNVSGFAISEASVIFETYKTQLAELLETLVGGASGAKIETNNGVVTMSMDFDPNVEMDYTFTLTWAWDFENGAEILDDEGNGTGVYEFDAADTLLGNLQDPDFVTAAATNTDWQLPEEADYSLVLAAHFVASATQID